MRSGVVVLMCAALAAACGGSVTSRAMDSGSAAEAGPPAPLVPDADVYGCEAASPGSPGCGARPGDPAAVYPEGCVLTTPHSTGTFCESPGVGCLPITCNCQSNPIDDGGLDWICPL
jgi:hypothetical protein